MVHRSNNSITFLPRTAATPQCANSFSAASGFHTLEKSYVHVQETNAVSEVGCVVTRQSPVYMALSLRCHSTNGFRTVFSSALSLLLMPVINSDLWPGVWCQSAVHVSSLLPTWICPYSIVIDGFNWFVKELLVVFFRGCSNKRKWWKEKCSAIWFLPRGNVAPCPFLTSWEFMERWNLTGSLKAWKETCHFSLAAHYLLNVCVCVC